MKKGDIVFNKIFGRGIILEVSPDSARIKFDFICCLKPMFAQKIANNFAANISRVGIDQFEWLRLKGRE